MPRQQGVKYGNYLLNIGKNVPKQYRMETRRNVRKMVIFI